LNSPSFSNLAQRVDELKSRYITDDYNELGDYSQEQQDDARACVLLTHAEMESFFENLARKAADVAVEFLDRDKHNELTTRFIFAAGLSDTIASQKHSTLCGAAKALRDLHKKAIGSNHGIKEENIRTLFGPYININELDAELVGQLNALGSLRGKYAHNGALGIEETINPKDVDSTIQLTVDCIRGFDEIFAKYLADGHKPSFEPKSPSFPG